MFKIYLTIFILTISVSAALANSSQWGTGMYGGMQNCPYNVSAGQGVRGEDSAVKEIQTALTEANKQLRTKKAEKKKLDREVERLKTTIGKSIASDYSDFIFEHIENSRHCAEYKGLNDDMLARGKEGEKEIAGAASVTVHYFSVSEWAQYCDKNKSGSVSASVCDNVKFREDGESRGNSKDCKTSLSSYKKSYLKSQKIQSEIERLEETIARTTEELSEARIEAASNPTRDSSENMAQGGMGGMPSQTEGGVCEECLRQGNGSAPQRQTDWANVAANLGTGALAMYAGYKTNQMVANYNANIGWPTQATPTWSYGYPYIMNGLYGALSSGTGQGSFGCGSGVGGGVNMGASGNMNGSMGMTGAYGTGGLYSSMGGAFGYPSGMTGNTMGGGMYNGGMGSWGMNGPWGTGGVNSGYGINAGIGAMMGMGSMMGYGNMMGGYGSMIGTGNMMGYGNMMNGYGTMSGTMSGSYDPGMSQLQLQMQQQLMQSQLQQYQTYMQYQQQYQQQQLQKYQSMSSLQQEMYSLMARIQQIQYGGTTSYGTTGYSGGTSTTSYIGGPGVPVYSTGATTLTGSR